MGAVAIDRPSYDGEAVIVRRLMSMGAERGTRSRQRASEDALAVDTIMGSITRDLAANWILIANYELEPWIHTGVFNGDLAVYGRGPEIGERSETDDDLHTIMSLRVQIGRDHRVTPTG
jgi:hypothetical protein